LSTVTPEESIPYLKRPGESHFLLGLPFGLVNGSISGGFGLSLAYSYETEKYRINVTGLGAWGNSASAMLLGIGADYLFLPGSWSPYLGGGVGYMLVANNVNEHSGLGFTADIGAEMFRLNRVRMLAGLEALMPVWNVGGSYTPALLLHVQVGF
jgi:hypothetical protein